MLHFFVKINVTINNKAAYKKRIASKRLNRNSFYSVIH